MEKSGETQLKGQENKITDIMQLEGNKYNGNHC